MPVNVKELIVVLGISILVFAFGKATALHFMDEADFMRRRNIWLILSAAAFLSPTFWWFTLIAAPTLYWAGKNDTNPLALYLLLMNVIPSISIPIPTGGLPIQQLFNLNIFRLLSLCVLVPAAWRLRNSREPNRVPGFDLMDYLLIGFGLLKVALFVSPYRPDHIILHNSFTNMLRGSFLFFIDIYVLYYIASRSCTTRRAIVDAMAAFAVSCIIMASVASFESVKHWLVYSEIYTRWGGHRMERAYILRAGLLRAEASSGNALVLGYLLAIGFGFWLYLQSRVKSTLPKVVVPVLLWLGLFASYSRGPWLGAILIYVAYGAFRPQGLRRVLKSSLIVFVLAAVTLVSPIGKRIRSTLPFLGGKLAESSLNYRERLLDRSWQLIQAHPLLGDQHALFHMQSMIQGQGIIDIVNTYVGVTLFHGLLGLALFLGFLALALTKAGRTARRTSDNTPNLAFLGATLCACIVGTLFMMADCSFFLGYVSLFSTLTGLATAYSNGNDPRKPRSEVSTSVALTSDSP